MNKRRIPLLEFDNVSPALINPIVQVEKLGKIPNRLIICFFKEVIASLLEKDEIFIVKTISSEGPSPIVYKFRKHNVAIIGGQVGAPLCGGILEECIALGAKKIMFCGGGGSVCKDITVGKYVVVDSAIRDEGTSFHYAKPSYEIKANLSVVNHIVKVLENKNIPYVKGKCWTTDAFYRETKDKIALRKAQDVKIVEMEQSALIAISKYRKVKYGAIIYGGDDVSKEVWDNRIWKSRKDIREELLYNCLEIVKTF